MKPHNTLPVKRRPAQKGMFRRIFAVTNNRKQRVAATADAETELEDGSSKISRALTIIFVFHILAIGLIFVHQRFLDGRPGSADGKTARKLIPVAQTKPRELDLPRIASSDAAYPVSRGDNYARIAEKLGVDEAKLRSINDHAEIRPGAILKVPAKEPQRIIATEPPEVTAIRHPGAETPAPADGLVDAVDVRGAPRATVVKTTLPPEPLVKTTAKTEPKAVAKTEPKTVAKTAAKPAASGKSHTLQNGESIWKVASRHGVSPEALMKANGIKDAKKVRAGTNLVIP